MQIINQLIQEHDYSSYLEIGVSQGVCFRQIKCEKKESVDPALGQYKHANPTHKMTSDAFFNSCDDETKWDIIFIDGLHEANQVYRDIQNSLNHLNDNGVIVCHDMNPMTEEAQNVPRTTKVWNGDCWKAFVQLRTERNDLEMFVYDTDQGVGIIKKTKKIIEPLILDCELTYENLKSHRDSWLNLTSIT